MVRLTFVFRIGLYIYPRALAETNGNVWQNVWDTDHHLNKDRAYQMLFKCIGSNFVSYQEFCWQGCEEKGEGVSDVCRSPDETGKVRDELVV